MLNGLAEFIGIVVWLIVWARGVPSAALPAWGSGVSPSTVEIGWRSFNR